MVIILPIIILMAIIRMDILAGILALDGILGIGIFILDGVSTITTIGDILMGIIIMDTIIIMPDITTTAIRFQVTEEQEDLQVTRQEMLGTRV